MTERIERGLALAMAGQVAVGLAEGDDQIDRCKAALAAIGMMLLTATEHDDLIQKQLAAADTARLMRLPDGGWQIDPLGL